VAHRTLDWLSVERFWEPGRAVRVKRRRTDGFRARGNIPHGKLDPAVIGIEAFDLDDHSLAELQEVLGVGHPLRTNPRPVEQSLDTGKQGDERAEVPELLHDAFHDRPFPVLLR